ncbi:dienelactone hydrolase family protein [Anaeromyxobacter diazotrophicus]|uniref:Dienelactone hydrolase n=1 Tax=Anaeromyxobacter diazotrophicus TaxID=2590199 RepID=A0A7I9VR20_9BACT|nr:dienelactone hydrolase family protein [Anaeromyxobacter diazotrophicus]GEJ58855.1 dienelactone hydrolase [Anaeromyxobacter diazotrophicus]
MHGTKWVIAAFLALAGATARAEVKTKVIDYRQGDTALEGFLAWDDAAQGSRPGVLVIHEAWGENQHARDQAVRLARAGYVGFALDMYGKGKVTKHLEDAKAFMAEASKDPAVVRARFEAARKLLQAQPQVDPKKIGAVGYCFGGNVALNMARAGEDLAAVATFHAAIPSADQPVPGKVKPRILINTGGDDPLVPKSQIDAFVKELKDAGADISVITYPHAKHSFTNPEAAQAGMDALGYDADADRKSWEASMKMFQAAFKG